MFSEKSLQRISDFTFLPNSSTINTTINTNINQNIVNITTPNFNNNIVIYINLSDSGDIINYTQNNTNSIQSIEISRPFFSNQENTTIGYGKFIDNSLALVSINVSVNDINKQTIIFDGSFGATEAKNIYNNTINIDVGSGSFNSPYYNFSIDVTNYNFVKGYTYIFNRTSSNHPFYIGDNGYNNESNELLLTGNGSYNSGIISNQSIILTIQ